MENDIEDANFVIMRSYPKKDYRVVNLEITTYWDVLPEAFFKELMVLTDKYSKDKEN